MVGMVAPEAAVPTGLPLNPANGQFSDPSRSVLVYLSQPFSLSLSLFEIFSLSLSVSLEQQHKDVSHFWFIFFPPAFNPDLNPDLEERRERKRPNIFLSSSNFLPSSSSFIEPKPRSLFLATFPARHELIPKTFPSFSLSSSAPSLSRSKLLVFLHLLPLFSFNNTIINPQFHSNDFTRLYDQLPFQF